ncbi:MAG: DUF2029 domain-containing protein [Pirellulales bacterium]|nr:DUF2029 domain-containing protein [Pirellulales bacterium]
MGWIPERRTFLRLSIAAAGILIAAAIAAHVRKPRELPVYLKAAQRFVAGEQIYLHEPKAFTYPPFFVLPFVPLVPLAESVQRVLWWAANIGMLVAIVGIVWSLVRPTLPEDPRKRRLCAVAAGLLSAKFLLSPLEHESHDLIVLWMIVLSAHYACERRQAAAGCFAGIAAACKATPLLMLPYFLWRRMWAAAGVMLLAGIAATLLPDFLTSNPDAKFWFQTWNERFVSRVEVGESPDLNGAWAAWNPANQSLTGTARRWFQPVTPGPGRMNVCFFPLRAGILRGLVLAAHALLLALIGWATWPRCGSSTTAAVFEKQVLTHYGALVCGMLLFSPMSSPAHFCGLVLPLAVLAGEIVQRPRRPAILAALAAVALFGPLSAQDLVGRPLSDLLQALGAQTLCTMACLLSMVWFARETDGPQEVFGPTLAENSHPKHRAA